MDHSWIQLPRKSDEYRIALNAFLDDSFLKNVVGNQICCPRKMCKRRFWCYRADVFDHVIVNRFVKGYKEWAHQKNQSLSCGDSGNMRNINDNRDGVNTYDDKTFQSCPSLLLVSF